MKFIHMWMGRKKIARRKIVWKESEMRVRNEWKATEFHEKKTKEKKIKEDC